MGLKYEGLYSRILKKQRTVEKHMSSWDLKFVEMSFQKLTFKMNGEMSLIRNKSGQLFRNIQSSHWSPLMGGTSDQNSVIFTRYFPIEPHKVVSQRSKPVHQLLLIPDQSAGRWRRVIRKSKDDWILAIVTWRCGRWRVWLRTS